MENVLSPPLLGQTSGWPLRTQHLDLDPHPFIPPKTTFLWCFVEYLS